MFNINRIGILELACIGDRVFHNACETDDSWGYYKAEKEPMQGKVGTITSLTSVRWYVPRYGSFFNARANPGVYMREVGVDVMCDEGFVTQHQNLGDLSWMPPKVYDTLPHFEWFKTLRNFNRMMNKDRQAARPEDRDAEEAARMTWVEPLPELPFFELDAVSTSHGDGYVNAINWQYWGETRTDGSPMPLFDVRLGDGGNMSFEPHEMKLISRGKVWDWYYGSRNPEFSSTEEAYTFFMSMGMLVPVRNKTDEPNGVTFEVACQRISGGEADVMIPNGNRNRTARYSLYKGKTEEVTKLVRRSPFVPC